MRRIEKAQRISEILENLYPNTPIPLDHEDPYTLLVKPSCFPHRQLIRKLTR